MPRRKPESVKEVRYEFSLGPKEQPLVEELTDAVKSVNEGLTITKYAAIALPIGIAAVGYGLFEMGKYIGAGISSFGAGLTPGNLVKGVAEYSTPGIILNALVPESERYNEDGTEKSTTAALFDELSQRLGKGTWW